PERQRIAETAPMSFFICFLDGQRAPLVFFPGYGRVIHRQDSDACAKRRAKGVPIAVDAIQARDCEVLGLDRSQGPGETVHQVDVSVPALPQSERHVEGSARRGAVVCSRQAAARPRLHRRAAGGAAGEAGPSASSPQSWVTATVLTEPVVTFKLRMAELPESAMTICVESNHAMPIGSEKRAADPVPSA